MVYIILKLASIKPSKSGIVFLEGVNLALIMILFLKSGLTASSVILSGVTSALVALSYTDTCFWKIYNKNILVILVLSIINIIISFSPSFLSDAFAGMIVGGGFFYIISIVSKMGGGDIKLMGVLGLLLGLKGIITVILIAFVSAGIYAAFALLLKLKDRKSYIPLGPFISLAAYVLFISSYRIIT